MSFLWFWFLILWHFFMYCAFKYFISLHLIWRFLYTVHTRNKIFVGLDNLSEVIAKTKCRVIQTTWLRDVWVPSIGDTVCLLWHMKKLLRALLEMKLFYTQSAVKKKRTFAPSLPLRALRKDWPPLRPEALVLTQVTQRSTPLTSLNPQNMVFCDPSGQ